jgi:hypothetical protein
MEFVGEAQRHSITYPYRRGGERDDIEPMKYGTKKRVKKSREKKKEACESNSPTRIHRIRPGRVVVHDRPEAGSTSNIAC